jgi:hypothetical protein
MNLSHIINNLIMDTINYLVQYPPLRRQLRSTRIRRGAAQDRRQKSNADIFRSNSCARQPPTFLSRYTIAQAEPLFRLLIFGFESNLIFSVVRNPADRPVQHLRALLCPLVFQQATRRHHA